MSQSDLARRVGVSPQSVQQWEKPDGTAPKRARIAKVADVLGVSIADIVTEVEDKFPPMRKDVLALIERMIDIGAANRISHDDIDTLNRMLNHMVVHSGHAHTMRRDDDWLVGGPDPISKQEEKKGEKG